MFILANDVPKSEPCEDASYCGLTAVCALQKGFNLPNLLQFAKNKSASVRLKSANTKILGTLIVLKNLEKQIGESEKIKYIYEKMTAMRDNERNTYGGDLGLLVFVFTTVWLLLFQTNLLY